MKMKLLAEMEPVLPTIDPYRMEHEMRVTITDDLHGKTNVNYRFYDEMCTPQYFYHLMERMTYEFEKFWKDNAKKELANQIAKEELKKTIARDLLFGDGKLELK